MPNGKGLEVGQEGISICGMEVGQSPTDSWVHFHTRALSSALHSSQCKADESRDVVQEAFPPRPSMAVPK